MGCSLWKAHGQAALENAKVCLLNGNAVGTETLKNLVLPGIGSFTVVDGKTVTGSDVGNNFFLTPDCIGKPRAQCVTQLLRELNEEVDGYHVDESPATLIENKPDFFLDFTIVIASVCPNAPAQLPEKSLLKLADLLWSNGIPLVVVRTNGFMAMLRVAVPEHAVVETHPDAIIDLRLDRPFPALQSFYRSFDLTKLDGMQFGHVPYVVLLLLCLDEFKAKQGGALPSTSAERAEFKELIRSKQRSDANEQENFEEAMSMAYRAWAPTQVPASTKAILDDPACQKLTSQSSNFWVIARAVKDFVDNEGEGCLPLAGTVPDMKSDTESYVALQTAYRSKARQDCAAIKSRVSALLTSPSVERPADSISAEEVERFCKNAGHVKLMRYRSLKDEHNKAKGSDIARWLEDLDSNVVYYVLFRAVDRFYETHKRYPGVHNEEVESDINLLKKCVTALLSKWGVTSTSVSDDHIHEMVRAGGSELHNISALMGGIASQEVIKLITKQYIPLDNTLVFNGMKSTSSTFVL
ncbi:NEDD8-activating enzyme E1 regulatory subunit [Quaeritorhiza haematococci]|nr:NEDD8-activating enzyme E1 regulatory subunit [Quaeritorhiza haematococci]